MKSNTKKRLIAFMLCMVLVLSSTISAFADEPQNTDSQSQAEVVTEPAADEPQNTDSQSQAEVVTEPAADEATEDTTTEDTTTEDVSTENTITEDVSDTPDIEIPSKKEWSVQVGNATVKVNGSADALPADAQLSVTEITSEDEVKEIEKAVEEKAIEEQFSIKNIFSYDIKFLVNGSEVQPTTPVQVSVDTPEITSSENAAVLHVDDNNVAEDMKGAVDGEGKVVFDAPHFSKYVIVQKGNSKVNVTIEYYDDTQNSKPMIYASKKELSPGESISNYDIADNWKINWAAKSTTDGNFERISDLNEIKFVSDCTIKVYYTPKDETIAGSTKFYDYTVKAGAKNGTYYSFNQLTNDKSPNIVNNHLPSAKIQQVDQTQMTNISFYKTDAEGNGLPGAQFSLTNDSTQATMPAVSDSEGLVQFQQLVAGTYTLTETQAPKGYVAPTTSWKVKVTADSNKNLSAKIYLADGRELGKLTGGEYQIINSASTPVQPPTPGIVETKKELSHEKYIAKNKDGTYNLTLNVSGAVGSESYANKLDVLFVMDTSNSMKWAMTYSGDSSKKYLSDYRTNSESRFYNQQKAVEDAIAKLKNKKNVDAQFAVVAFDTQAGIKTNWTKDSITYPTSVGNYESNNWEAGGTNYQAGLRKADELLKKGRTDATKIVVFLSDGDPTLYYGTNIYGQERVYGSGSGYDKDAMTNAQAQLGTMSMNYFYTVGVGPQKSYSNLSSLISSAPSGTVTGSYNGTDSSNLKNAFDSIIRDATELLCTDVTVTDTLTDEVELVNQNLQVVVKDETGKVITKLKDASGNEAAVSKIITVSTAKDSDGKTQIIMRFEPSYKLESGYTYYVTAKIRPTTKAYLEYQNGSYTGTGDKNTDEYLGTGKKPGNDTRNNGTSSEQNGFYSNVSANVTYKYNNKTYTKPYAKPVIQVNDSTVSHTVDKKWENDSDKVAVDVELKAYVTKAADSEINDDNPKYLTSEDVKTLPTSMKVNLSGTNQWTHTWDNLPDTYYYETTDGIKQTDIHYTVEEVQTDATKAFYGQVTESSDGMTTTILNKKKDQEDKPFIEVTKTFEGLTKAQIKELADANPPYTITLIQAETNTTKQLVMDVSKLNDILKGSDDKKVWTYTWKLEDCLDGTYKVSESNYGKDGYDVTVTVNGQQVTDSNDFSVSTKQASIKEYKQSRNTTMCSPKTFSINKVNLIVAKLTANEGYFVWTNTPVSISERKAIVKLISDKTNGIRFSPEAELKKCYFYSGNGIKDTLVFRNGEIKYDGQDKLTFDASKQWSMFAAGTYTFTETQNAEIQITNTYLEQTADLDLIKTSVSGTKFDGAEFKLYKKNDKGEYELQKFAYTDESGKDQTRETIQVINTDRSEAELKNLQSGQYYLEEVKAPEACMLLADKIYFKQEKGKITLTDKSGKVLADSPTMWTLSGTDGKYTLTVQNEILYSLPSAGGTGIYLYMIGGILLMFAAVWILYKNKCKEVLEK